MSSVLATEGLTKRFAARTAVDGIDLRVENGDVFGFLGPNGAGKSTTLRMVLGLIRPTGGRITLLGRSLPRHRQSVMRRVGAIVEAPAFYEQLTGRRNLQMLAALSGGCTPGRIDEALELVGLRARAGDPVAHYSHGMRQRLGIAQALLPWPELIILDEPSDGLDPQGIHEMRLLLGRLRDELALTVLLSSHLLGEVEKLCNRVAIIQRGRLLYQGETRVLVAEEPRVRLRVDCPDAAVAILGDRARRVDLVPGTIELPADEAQAARANAALVARGIAVTELVRVRPTLEDAFLRLTRADAAAERTQATAQRT